MYIGSRPQPPPAFYPPPTESEVKASLNMVSWLEKRKVTPKFFCSIVRGDAGPKASQEAQTPVAERSLSREPNPFHFSQEPGPSYGRQGPQESWAPAFPGPMGRSVYPNPNNLFSSHALYFLLSSSFTIFLGLSFTTASTYPIRRELMLLEVLLAGPIYSGWRC